MPPRYAYWTILVDNQATAFRAGSQEDLLPTFKRLKERHPSATMMWFQNGKLWPSRIDAQEAMRARGEMGRRGDERQGGFRSRDREFKTDRPAWKPKGFAADGGESRRSSRAASEGGPQARKPSESGKLDWKPKGEFTPAPKRAERPDWKPKASFDRDRKPEWKSKTRDPGSRAWKPKGSFDRDRKPDWKPKGSSSKPEPGKLEWKPRTESGTRKPEPETRAKRAWIPKEEYKKSLGIEAKRDGKWRPGGEHRDPRQKYKDAKKAKWTKFKKTIRSKWETKKKG